MPVGATTVLPLRHTEYDMPPFGKTSSLISFKPSGDIALNVVSVSLDFRG